MKKMLEVLFTIVFAFAVFPVSSQQQVPVPSSAQLRWHNYERIMFLHFVPNPID